MTKEQEKISEINKQKAREYFGITGNNNLILHHIDPSWRHNDIERYILWNIEDLVVMTRSEHTIIHHTGLKHSKEWCDNCSKSLKGKSHPQSLETRKKISESQKGKKRSDEFRKKMSIVAKNRKPLSKESIMKMANSLKKLKWYNNGIKNVRTEECPEGFVPGRISWK